MTTVSEFSTGDTWEQYNLFGWFCTAMGKVINNTRRKVKSPKFAAARHNIHKRKKNKRNFSTNLHMIKLMTSNTEKSYSRYYHQNSVNQKPKVFIDITGEYADNTVGTAPDKSTDDVIVLDDTAVDDSVIYVGTEKPLNNCDNSVICIDDSSKYDKLQIASTANYIVNNWNKLFTMFRPHNGNVMDEKETVPYCSTPKRTPPETVSTMPYSITCFNIVT